MVRQASDSKSKVLSYSEIMERAAQAGGECKTCGADASHCYCDLYSGCSPTSNEEASFGRRSYNTNQATTITRTVVRRRPFEASPLPIHG